jgi:hypothetical protein
MRNDQSLAQLAAECEQRAKEVQSAGDRAQLLRIAKRFRHQSLVKERPLRIVISNEPFPTMG